MSDRRHFPRIHPEPGHPVRVDINGENFLDILHASDIGEGGVGFHVDHPFSGRNLERPVHFIIGLPQGVLVSAEGKIRYVSAHAFGIEFGVMSPSARQQLHDYIHHRLEE